MSLLIYTKAIFLSQEYWCKN